MYERGPWGVGAEVHAADAGLIDPDDAMRTFIRQILGAAAQLDKAMTVERLRKARAKKAERGGKAVGQYPFGMGGRHQERESVVLADICARMAAGQEPAVIAAALNSLPYDDSRTRSGKPWTAANVTRVAGRL